MARATGGEASIVWVAVHMFSPPVGQILGSCELDPFAVHTDRLRGEVAFGFGKSI